jgi:hypothetical protein
MRVVAYSESSWYLLKEKGSYYFDVHCTHSFVGFSMLIHLNSEAYEEYHALGKVFLEYFAAKINYGSAAYKPRQIQGDVLARSYETIMAWKNKL